VSLNRRSDRAFPRLNIFLTIAFLCAFESVIVAQTLAPEKPSAEKISALKRAVVIVTTFDTQNKPLLQGSGFFIKHDCIVTNLHVVKGAGTIRITTFEGRTSTVEIVIATNEEADLALLKVENSATADVLQLEDAVPFEGERVLVVSNPQGSPWTITRGRLGLLWHFGGISSRIQITAVILPGSSGGPVLNEQGHVIGIAAMHIPSTENLNFAVPAENLKNLLQSSKNRASDQEIKFARF